MPIFEPFGPRIRQYIDRPRMPIETEVVIVQLGHNLPFDSEHPLVDLNLDAFAGVPQDLLGRAARVERLPTLLAHDLVEAEAPTGAIRGGELRRIRWVAERQ